jgi:hypothetical protein
MEKCSLLFCTTFDVVLKLGAAAPSVTSVRQLLLTCHFRPQGLHAISSDYIGVFSVCF